MGLAGQTSRLDTPRFGKGCEDKPLNFHVTNHSSTFFQNKPRRVSSHGVGPGFTVAMSDSHSSTKGAKPLQRTSRYFNTSTFSRVQLIFSASFYYLIFLCCFTDLYSASHVPAHLADFKERLAQLSQLDPSTPSVALHTVTTQQNE